MAMLLRKMVAWIIVLSMSIGLIVLPAAAAEDGTSTTTTTTAEITDDSGNVIGTITTKTETTKTEDKKTYNEVTNTDSQWKTEQSETGSTGTPENGTTTSVVTEVTGTEQKTDSVNSNKETGVQTYSGTASGSEDTTITDTTTTVTTKENELFSDTTEGPTTTINGKAENGEWSDYEQVGKDGEWVENPSGDTSTGYQKVDGSEKKTTETTDIDVDNDPLKKDDAVLNLTPGGTDTDKVYVSIEDALKNDITYTEGKQADGSVVTFEKDKDGNVIGYTITSTTDKPGTPGKIQGGTEGEKQKFGSETKIYVKPEGYTPCENAPILDDDGNQIGTKTIKEVTDKYGNVIGYEITEVKTESKPTTSTPSTEEGERPEDEFTLPERPMPPAPKTDKYGMTTTVTVEDIIENGAVVGFKTTTTITDEDGNVASTESESIFGTKTTYSSTIEKTPETDVITTTTVTTVLGTEFTQNYTTTTSGTATTENYRDVTQDIYQLVKTENGLYFLFEGKMYQVESIGTHGDVTMTGLQPNISGLEPGTDDGYVSTSTLLRNPEDFTVSADRAGINEGYEFEYVGYGLETAIRVDKNYETGAGEVLAHQFVLKDAQGNKHYVLCADLGTSAVRGADYNMVNVDSADYYVRDGAAEMIQAIALSGYWGTTSGVGSLDAVKQFLRDNTSMTEAQINALKPGEALTATQAAIWYYGNSDASKTMNDEAITGDVYKSNGDLRDATADEAIRINTLYQALIGIDPDDVTDNTTEFITENNFAEEVKLTIKEKATDSSGNVKIDSNSKTEKYVTDLTFSLDVKQSDITGNLKITVKDEYGNVLAERQLATDNSNFVGELLAEDSVGSGTYTIPNIEIAEGVKIDLNLSGTQNLNQGVYLYSAEVYSDSQTFVGIASGQRKVDLNVSMEFSVTDPKAEVKHTNKTWTEKETEKESYTKTNNYKKTRKGTETTEVVTVNTKVYGTSKRTDVATKTTDKHRDWSNSYLYKLIDVDEEDGGDDDGGRKWKNIFDEDVPLASAPKTGDISYIWVVLSLMSAGGLVVLNRKKED